MDEVIEFKAAVYLNNAGLTLLRRGYFQAGLNALTQAIRTFHASTDDNHDGAASTNVEEMLQSAYRLISTCTTVSENNQVDGHQDVVVSVFSLSDYSGGVASSNGHSPEVVTITPHPVFIVEPIDFEIPNQGDVIVSCAVILYNYAMSLLSAARVHGTSSTAVAHCNSKAHAILNLTLATLSSHDLGMGCVHFERRHVILLQYLVLHHLSRLSSITTMARRSVKSISEANLLDLKYMLWKENALVECLKRCEPAQSAGVA